MQYRKIRAFYNDSLRVSYYVACLGCKTLKMQFKNRSTSDLEEKQKNKTFSFENIHFSYMALLLFFWTIPGLIGHEPWKPDEAYSFGLILNIYETGDWVVPMLAGEPFMEKPPIYYIVAAVFMVLLHPLLSLPDAARLTSGFFIVITSSMIALSVRDTLGKGYGRWGILIFISCLGVAVRMHQMITDTALVAGCSFGLYGLILSRRRFIAGGVVMGIGAALGMMSKGLLGPGLLYLSAALCFFILGSYRKKSFINSILIALAVTMLLSFPWILALWHRSTELLHLWFWDNNLGRFLGTNNLGPKKGHLFYLYTLSWYAFPALPMCLLYFLTKNRKVLRDGISVSLIFFMVTFFTLSLSSDARELYALPLLLPLSVIAAAAVPISVIPSFSSFLKGLSFSLILLLIFIGLLVNLPFAFSPLREFVNSFVPGYDPDINPLLVIISLAAPLAVLIVIMKTDSSKTPTVFYFSCLMTIIWSIIMTLGLPLIDYSKRYSDVFSQIQMIVPKGECVISQGLGEPQRAMLHYYTGIKTSRVENGSLNESCHYLLRQGKTTTEKKSFHDLIWSGSRPGEEDEFYEVFKTH